MLPGCFGTGIDSPVREDWLTVHSPSSIDPSAGMIPLHEQSQHLPAELERSEPEFHPVEFVPTLDQHSETYTVQGLPPIFSGPLLQQFAYFQKKHDHSCCPEVPAAHGNGDGKSIQKIDLYCSMEDAE